MHLPDLHDDIEERGCLSSSNKIYTPHYHICSSAKLQDTKLTAALTNTGENLIVKPPTKQLRNLEPNADHFQLLSNENIWWCMAIVAVMMWHNFEEWTQDLVTMYYVFQS